MPVLSRILAIIASCGLTGCAAWCPDPNALVARGPFPANCQTLIDKLQNQDALLKATVNSTAPLARKHENARIIQGNLKIHLEPLPRVCPANLAGPLSGEVKQRIGQIDEYLTTGIWIGPVG